MEELSAKRIFDVLAALAGIALTAPLMLAAAAAVKCGSAGPVFYTPLRTGRHGVPFRIYKFRTMVDGAEGLGGSTTALFDPRVTCAGKILRRLKLDELPQLFNILQGQMSFVGPRPELPEYTARYRGEELEILGCLPGLTDYSSLRFFSLDREVGSESADRVYEERILPEKNRLRLQYARERTFAGDMVLIAKTALVLFSSRTRSAPSEGDIVSRREGGAAG